MMDIIKEFSKKEHRFNYPSQGERTATRVQQTAKPGPRCSLVPSWIILLPCITIIAVLGAFMSSFWISVALGVLVVILALIHVADLLLGAKSWRSYLVFALILCFAFLAIWLRWKFDNERMQLNPHIFLFGVYLAGLFYGAAFASHYVWLYQRYGRISAVPEYVYINSTFLVMLVPVFLQVAFYL